MRQWLAVMVISTGLMLSGCQKGPYSEGEQSHPRGRYSGVGIYAPSRQWTKLIAEREPADPQRARPIDDQVIIVVQDSTTGEVRACGDLTGYCIGLNPWRTALVASQIAPVRLSEHLAPDEATPLVGQTTAPDRHAKPNDEAGSTAGR